jgi:SPP1 gp7 family putative phage head morphogenesis protein
MKFDLASRVKRPSRKPIMLANIVPTQAQAGDLARIYLRIVAAWRAGTERINAAYERTIAELTTDSPADVRGAIDAVAAEIDRLVLLLTPDLRDWALTVERVHRGKWVASVLSATSVDLNTVLTPGDVSDTVQAALEWNTALVRDVAEETRRKISNAVFAGMQRRAPAREIAKEISDTVGLARSRSLRIAADQTTKLGAQLNRARQVQAGLTKYKWRHSGKRHPREWHKDRDGKVFPWDGPGSIPDDDEPSIPPYCGCTGQGVISFEDA